MNQLSRTCVLVAAARAFGSREPDPAVRNPDYLAGKLLRPEDVELIEGHPLCEAYAGDYEAGVDQLAVIGIVWMMLIRTRFIDAALQKAIADGVTQVAILGAGLDTRAHRFGDLLRGCKVVEADAAPTQQYKLKRLTEVASLPPDSVRYAEINLIHDDLTQVLERAGLNRDEKTFFILEGVSMYLTEEEVTGVLKQIASFGAPGSRLALDYRTRNDELSRSVPHGADLMAKWGEPWKDGIPSDRAEEFFRECGFRVVQQFPLNDMELIKRYAFHADGTVYGMKTFRRMQEEAEAKFRASGGTGPLPPPPPFFWLAELSN